MKRMIALLLAAVMLCTLPVATQAEDTSVLEKIEAANRIETMLQQAERIAYRSNTYDARGGIHSQYAYADKDLIVCENDDGITIDQDGQRFGFDNNEKRPFAAIFLDDAQESVAVDSLTYAAEPAEQLLECTQEEGKLTVNSFIDDMQHLSDCRAYLMDLGYASPEILRLCCRYVLEEASYEIESITFTVDLADGSSLLVWECTRVESPEPYEIPQELTQQLFSEDSRTVTVILDPDSQEEQEISIQVGKGCLVRVYPSDAHPNIYRDRSCFQLYTGFADPDSDELRYSIRAELDPYCNMGKIRPNPSAEEMVQCDTCGNWYIAGNAFRNHICSIEMIQPLPEDNTAPQEDETSK